MGSFGITPAGTSTGAGMQTNVFGAATPGFDATQSKPMMPFGTSTTNPSGLFGAGTTPTPGTSFGFGTSTNPTPSIGFSAPSTSSLFSSQPTTQQQPSTAPLFGSTPSGGFGTGMASTTTPSVFGSTPSGFNTTQTAGTPSIFGAPGSSATSAFGKLSLMQFFSFKLSSVSYICKVGDLVALLRLL